MEQTHPQDLFGKDDDDIVELDALESSMNITKDGQVREDKHTYFVDQTFDDYIQQFANDTECPLCAHQATKPKHLAKHLRSSHLNHSICFIYNEVSYCCLPCRKMCIKPDAHEKTHRSHFHCPCCKKIITRSKNFKHHVTMRIGKCAKSKLSASTIKDNVGKVKKELDLVTVVVDNPSIATPVNVNNMNDRDDILSAASGISADEQQEVKSPKKRKYWSAFQLSHPSAPRKVSRYDADEMFLKCLLPEMHNITGERKLKLKMEIMHLVHDAAYGKQN